MITQQTALAYINGGWRNSAKAKTIDAAGGLGIDVDGLYGFQCKDLVNDFAASLGAPFPAGNAIVLQNPTPPAGWSFVASPQAGDVALRDYISGGVNYGDAILVVSVAGTNMTVMGQNQIDVSLTVGHVPTTSIRLVSTYKAFLRRNYDVPPAAPVDPNPAPTMAHPLTQYVGHEVNLAASVSSWHVYPVGSVVPRSAVAILDPAMYGGISYLIEATDTDPDSVIVTTQMFGRVSLPIAQDSAGNLYPTATIS